MYTPQTTQEEKDETHWAKGADEQQGNACLEAPKPNATRAEEARDEADGEHTNNNGGSAKRSAASERRGVKREHARRRQGTKPTESIQME
jgi:hypothetical protein